MDSVGNLSRRVELGIDFDLTLRPSRFTPHGDYS